MGTQKKDALALGSMEMVTPATATTAKKKKRAWEEEACPFCFRSRRQRTESVLVAVPPPPLPPGATATRISTSADSPVAYNLTALYALEHLSPKFGLLKPFLVLRPPAAPGAAATSPLPSRRDFTLQVTAQTATLPAPLDDPPLVLRLCLVRRWVERRPLRSPPAQAPGRPATPTTTGSTSVSESPEELEEVPCRSGGFAGHHLSSAARFLRADTALADVRRLLAAVSDCAPVPWGSMPIGYFAADAAARIYEFIRGIHQSGLLGTERFVCHLDVTVVHPRSMFLRNPRAAKSLLPVFCIRIRFLPTEIMELN